MPALYAHYTYCLKIKEFLDDELLQIIEKYPKYYEFGAQGPDMLFFYRFLKSNPTAKVASKMHHTIANELFADWTKIIHSYGKDSPQMAYALGFVTHFMLDSSVHGYIWHLVNDEGYDHTYIETEFEKYLLSKNHLNPFKYDYMKHLPTDICEDICVFYPGVTAKQLKEALLWWRFSKKISKPTSKAKVNFIVKLMKLLKIYKKHYGQLMYFDSDVIYDKTNKELENRLENSVELASQMVKAFYDAVDSGKPLPERFNINFE